MTTSLFSFFHSPLALIVSQTLLHFLWQGTLISLLAAGASHVLRKRTSTLRYGVFCFVFLLMAACPIVTFYSLAQRADSPTIQTMAIAPPTAAIPNVSALAPVSATAIKLAPLSSTPPPSLLDRLRSYDYAQLSPYVLAIYLAGVLMNLFRLIVGLYGGKTLRCTSSPVNDRAVLTVLARQVRILGLGFTPAIAYSRKVLVPTVVGVLRPMILIPAALATNLTPDQVEALLTHELAHLSRYDHLVNLLQRVIEAFEFFHPGVWYVSKLIRAEREHCCDDRVLAAGGRAASYASSLVEIAELCLSGSPARTDNPTALTLATQKSQLHHRVLRLLGVADHEQVRLSRPWMIIAVLFITITTAVTIAASHKTEKVSAVSTSPKYKNNVVFVNIDDFTSDTNGATGDMGPTGKITCGHPGAVSQVTWKFLTTSSEGDVYEFSRVFPSDTATPQTTVKQITYSGQQQVIFQDKVHRVIIKPKPIPSSQPGKKVSIKAVVFSVPRDADLSFLNEFIGQKQLNPYRGNLSQEQTADLLTRLRSIKDMQILSRPQITAYEHQHATIQIGQTVPWVQPDSKQVYSIAVGLEMGITAAVNSQGGLNAELELTKTLIKSSSNPQQPDILQNSDNVSAFIPDNHSLLVEMSADHLVRMVPRDKANSPTGTNETDFQKEPVLNPPQPKERFFFLLTPIISISSSQPATQPAGQDTNGGLPASNGEPRLHEKAMGRSPTATTLVLQILGPDGRPVAGARVGTQVCTVEGLDNISMNWDLGDNQTATESDNQGQVILAQEDLFRDQSPEQQDNVIYVLQKDRRIGGWFKIARKDFGKHIPLTLQTVCRVYGNFDSKGMRELGKPLTWSGAVIGTGLSSIMPLQYISKQRHFEFFLPPGSYNLMTYGGAADKQVRSDHVNTYYTILDGRQELDLGTIDLPPTKFSTILGKPAPELQVREWKNSSPIRMADLRGKVVLFYYGGNLLSSRDLSALAKLHEQFKDRGLVVFALYMFDSINQLQAAFTKNQAEITGLRDIPFPVGLDVAKQNRNPHLGATADAYGIAYSDTLLIDRNGNIVGRFDLQNGVQLESLLRINSSPPATQPAGQGSKDGQPTSNAQR